MKTLPFASLALVASAAFAADVSYTPTSPAPYLWSDLANWSGGALPGSGDNVLLSDSALGSSPLVVDGTTTRTANELHLKPASGATTLLEVASGATLTAAKLFMGDEGSGSSYNGALARVDNYGTINVTGFFMGRGNSTWATAGTPTIFHNHAGATFTHTGTGTWNFYFNRDGGSSLFINEGAMSNTSGSPVWLGMGQNHSELRIQGDGVFTANGDIRMGQGYPSTSYVVLADRGRITGSGAISVGHGNGQKATGYLVLSNDASIVKSAGRINIGTSTAGAKGFLQMHDNASVSLNDYLSIGDGASTTGSMAMDGDSAFSGTQVVVGSGNNSTGTVSIAGNARFNARTLYVGGTYSAGNGCVGTISFDGTAQAKIDGSAYVGMYGGDKATLSLAGESLLSVTNITLCRVSNTSATLEVGGSSAVTNLLRISVGTSDAGATGAATLAMRGGSVFLDIDPDGDFYLQHGYWNPIQVNPHRTASAGRIQGWGKVAFSDPATYIASSATPCGMSQYGQVIADGEGVARDLDFSRAAALNFSTTDANPSGTNGWFAVNKGRLRLPRSRPRTSNAAFCVGDCWTLDYAAAPRNVNQTNRLANTFTATFTGASTGNYLFADLYATDREDIPAGLDEIRPDRVISVWRIGLFDDGPEADEPSTPSTFTSAELRLRIPGDAVSGTEKLYVARHDGTSGGKWTIVGRLVDPNPKWPVVPARVSAPSAATWNLGWFAVIDRSTPFNTVLYIR